MHTILSIARLTVLFCCFLVLVTLTTSSALAQGTDTDGDGLVNSSDPDDDNDGVADAGDVAPLDPHQCRDVDNDTCDDCTIGTDGFGPQADTLPANDGPDADADGWCDAGDTGSNGQDTDGDGLINASDPDDDNDGVLNATDVDPLDPHQCEDADDDTCDDCTIGTDGFGPLADNLPNTDGPDTDGDGLCDAGDPCPPAEPGQPDSDSDGFSNACDCGPFDATVYPAAPEINDGEDNQCPGDAGHGLVDEVGSSCVFTQPDEFCWPPQLDATRYQVLRSSMSAASDCATFFTTDTCAQDPSVPAGGDAWCYTVQAVDPNTGSWGADSGGRALPVLPMTEILKL